MAFKYTEEQLNKLDKELLVQLFLGLQDLSINIRYIYVIIIY